MTATFASSAWPLSGAPTRGAAWRYGREIAVDPRPGAQLALQWLLRRNCSITPRQLAWVYLSLCGFSLLVAGFFFVQGAPYVLAFAAAELAAVGIAMLVFARHAGDRETLTLIEGSLQVELCYGSRVARADFAADWCRVEPAAGQGSLVQLSGYGQVVRVGRLLRPELRGDFARELRQALRRAPQARPTEPDSN